MKKTLITLLALAGVASADLTLTTGIEYLDDHGVVNYCSGYDDPGVDGLDYIHSDWPGSIINSEPLSFDIELGSLFGAGEIDNTDLMTLKTLTVKVHPQGWAMDGDREVTLSVKDKAAYSYNQRIEGNPDNVVRNGGELTMSNINWEGLTKDDTIVFTISGGSDHSVALASTSGLWTGVSTFDTTTSDWGNKGSGYTNVGSNAAPLVSLTITTTPNVPEPTTATLSLLALCGLAARRRRK